MKVIDVEALLEKNPGVDRDKLNEYLSIDFVPSSPVKSYGSASPYGGKRMIADDRPKLGDGSAPQYRTR